MRTKLLLTGLAAILGACTVGPDYRPSTPSVPDHWQATLDSNAALKPVDPATLKNVWRSFGDTRLNRLMDEALAGNLDLAMALTRIDQARAQARGTRAGLFPRVGLEAGGQRQGNPFPGFAPGISYNLFQLGFDALWEIDLFGRQQRRLEAATADLAAAREDYAQGLLTLTADVARAYTEYRSLQQQLRITHANLEAQRHTLRLTESLLAEGVGVRQDVVRTHAQMEMIESQIPALEAEDTALLRQLEVLTGKRPGELADLEEPAPLPSPSGEAILTTPAATIRQRPDLRAAERRLAAATALKGAAIAEWYPKVSLSAFLGFRNTDLDTLFKSAAFSYGTAAGLLQPLLDFGRIQAGVDLADARQREACLSYEKTVQEALRETETALTRYLKEEIRRQTLTRSVADLQESLRLLQLRYQEGVIPFLDVLDAQRTLYQADLERVRSEAATVTNLIAVYKALGGGVNGSAESFAPRFIP